MISWHAPTSIQALRTAVRVLSTWQEGSTYVVTTAPRQIQRKEPEIVWTKGNLETGIAQSIQEFPWKVPVRKSSFSRWKIDSRTYLHLWWFESRAVKWVSLRWKAMKLARRPQFLLGVRLRYTVLNREVVNDSVYYHGKQAFYFTSKHRFSSSFCWYDMRRSTLDHGDIWMTILNAVWWTIWGYTNQRHVPRNQQQCHELFKYFRMLDAYAKQKIITRSTSTNYDNLFTDMILSWAVLRRMQNLALEVLLRLTLKWGGVIVVE